MMEFHLVIFSKTMK